MKRVTQILLVILIASSSLYGQTKFNRNIPNNAHQAIGKHIKAGISTFAFAPNGGWALVSKNGRLEQQNIPSECEKKIKDFLAKGHKIKDVSFPPKGGNSWVILTDRAMYARNIPNECYKRLLSDFKKGNKAIKVSFPKKGGNSWVIIYEKGGFYARNIDDECYQILRNLRESDMPGKKAARKITNVTFAPNGGFVVLAEDYHFARNINDDCFSKMNSLSNGKNLIHTVAFNPKGKGWSIISNSKVTTRPKDKIRSFERNVVGKSIWQTMKDSSVAGVSVAVVINGRIAWSTAYGHLKMGARANATHPESMFQAASISKVIAALGAHKLVDQKKLSLTENLLTSGKLKWNVPFSNCIKNKSWTKNFKHLTVENILQHKSGIEGRGAILENGCNYTTDAQEGGGYGGYDALSKVPSLNTLMQNISITYDPSSGPNGNSRWYSGKAFTILQKLTKDVTKQEYSTWMKTSILNPLNMKKSAFTVAPERIYNTKELVLGHNNSGRAYTIRRYPQYAAAGLYTNAKELANVIIMMNNNGFINRKRFLSTVATKNLIENHMGVNVNSARTRYSHGGTNTGFKAYFEGMPKINSNGITHSGIVVLTNGDRNIRGAIASAIRQAYGW